LAGAAACGSSEAPSALHDVAGRAAFSITGLDVGVSALTYSITNAAGDLVDEHSADPTLGVAFELDLPAGVGYSVSVSAQTADGQSCSGSSRFDVAVGQRSDIALELRCTGTGQVSVVGTLTPACPQVAIATSVATLEVGASVVLGANTDGELGSAPVWAASAGQLAVVEGATQFTCTEPGPVSISLRAGPESCEASDSVTVTCAVAPATSACDGLGSSCHVVAESSAEADACHELGHGGDEAACAEGRAACVDTCGAALCTTLASLCHDVDPGDGPLHECHELAHAADAVACFSRGRECFDLCTRAHQEPVTLTFEARVGAAAFACGASVADVGSSQAEAEPRDFRFFVHDVRLVDADGNAVSVELDERAPWQARGVALLDFEDGSGSCVEGDTAVNVTVTGRVAPGTYTGLAFRVGVPESVNHGDPAVQPAPLAAGTMSWGWLSGYKFLRADLGTAEAGGVLHLGATGCSGDPIAGSVTCARPNRPDVTLPGFDPATSRVVADVGALFAGVDLDSAGPCHSAGDACASMFTSLGLDLASGASTGAQSVFSVTP
jgi:uncharacterized repeat protein (TIGR04052 family)